MVKSPVDKCLLLPQTQPLVRLPLLNAYMPVLTAIAAGTLYPWDNLGNAGKFHDRL